MGKAVTIQLDDETYSKLIRWAKRDNRPLENLIETAAMRFVEQLEFADDFEMTEIESNTTLHESLKRGLNDVESGRGRFV